MIELFSLSRFILVLRNLLQGERFTQFLEQENLNNAHKNVQKALKYSDLAYTISFRWGMERLLDGSYKTGSICSRAIHRKNRYPVDKCWQTKPRKWIYERSYIRTAEKDMKTWLIIAFIHTTYAVVKLKPEKVALHRYRRSHDFFEPFISQLLKLCVQLQWSIITSNLYPQFK